MHRTLPIGVGRSKAVRQELPDTARLLDRLGEKHRGCARRAYRSPVRRRPNGVIAFPLPEDMFVHRSHQTGSGNPDRQQLPVG